jgi:hypothetical protein
MSTNTAAAPVDFLSLTCRAGRGCVGAHRWMRVGNNWYVAGHRIVKHVDSVGVSYELLAPRAVYAGDYQSLRAAFAAIEARARRTVRP